MDAEKSLSIVRKKLERSNSLLNQLETSVNSLEKALEPISREDGPMKNDEKAIPTEGQSFLAVSLEGNNARLENLLDRINSQLSRLEI